jgi:hypothetical protein
MVISYTIQNVSGYNNIYLTNWLKKEVVSGAILAPASEVLKARQSFEVPFQFGVIKSHPRRNGSK